MVAPLPGFRTLIAAAPHAVHVTLRGFIRKERGLPSVNTVPPTSYLPTSLNFWSATYPCPLLPPDFTLPPGSWKNEVDRLPYGNIAARLEALAPPGSINIPDSHQNTTKTNNLVYRAFHHSVHNDIMAAPPAIPDYLQGVVTVAMQPPIIQAPVPSDHAAHTPPPPAPTLAPPPAPPPPAPPPPLAPPVSSALLAGTIALLENALIRFIHPTPSQLFYPYRIILVDIDPLRIAGRIANGAGGYPWRVGPAVPHGGLFPLSYKEAETLLMEGTPDAHICAILGNFRTHRNRMVRQIYGQTAAF